MTLSLDGYVTGSADCVDAAMGLNGFRSAAPCASSSTIA
jgi:hypothetical protein